MSAISLAISIEPIKVMQMSSKNSPRKLPETNTNRLARIVKNLILRRAHTTAKVKNRQTSVFQSK